MNRMIRNILRIIGSVLLMLMMLLVTTGAASYYLYYSPQGADLPCRGCDREARAVNVNGFDLYYREIGGSTDNTPIVLLHGGPGQSSQTFKDGFDFLANEHRVIFYDQRGSGNSQIKPDRKLYTIDLLVEELETLRRDVIQAEKIILIGHSAGGALTLRYAMKYPEHVEKIVLVCALPPNGGLPMGGLLMDSIVATMNVFGGNLPPADPLEADQQFNNLIRKSNMNRMYDPERTDLFDGMGYASFAVNRDLTRSTYGGNFDEQLSELGMPTLILYGEADHSSFTGMDAARHMHELIPNSVLAGFEHSGHWPYLEEPQQFENILLDFLDQQ